MRKLTIDRSTWLRGENIGSRLLRPSDGKMCCLGFYSLACGLTPQQINDHSTVHVVRKLTGEIPEEMHWLLSATTARASSDAYNLMHLNDYPNRSDADRERLIAETFAKHDIEVEFIN